MKSLRKSETVVVNLTGRQELSSRHIRFEIGPDSGSGRFEVQLLNWPEIRDSIGVNHVLTVTFSRGGYAEQTVFKDKARAALGRFGIVRGSVPPGYFGDGLTVTVRISNPTARHLLSLEGSKSTPDRTDAEIDEPSNDNLERIRPFRSGQSEQTGLLSIFESTETAGSWDIRWNRLESPQLRVSPKLGKERLLTDTVLLYAVLPAAFREILNVMVYSQERAEENAWFKPWQKFVLELTGQPDWSVFEEHLEDTTLDMTIEELIGEAVTAYTDKLVPAPTAASITE